MSVAEEAVAFASSVASSSAFESTSVAASSEAGAMFHAIFQRFYERQEKVNRLLDTLHSSDADGTYRSALAQISDRIKEFYLPEEDVIGSLESTTRWFSADTGARGDYLSTLSSLSRSNPLTAAGLTRDLFNLQQTFLDALGGTASGSGGNARARYFSTISSFELQAGLGTITESGESGARTTRLADLSLSLSIRQITASVGGNRFAALTGGSTSSFLLAGQSTNLSMYMTLLDPLVLDLNGDGLDLRPVDDGVVFDLAGNGRAGRCGFVQGDDALLFLDGNGDGVCDNGRELFGDQEGDAHGFAELGKYDLNTDGNIDDKDSVYADLRVWNDLNSDGTCTEEEVRSLTNAGVAAIGLGYRETREENHGNLISQRGFFQRFDGALRAVADARFSFCDSTATTCQNQ